MKSLDADKKASKTSEAAPAEAEKPVAKIDFSKVKVEPLFEEMVDFDTFSKSDFRAVSMFVIIKIPTGICNIIAGIIYAGLTYLILKMFISKIIKLPTSDFGMPKFAIKIRWILIAVLLPFVIKGSYLLIFNGKYVSSNMNGNQMFNTLSAGVAFTGIAAGFVEEMVFRGVILNALKKRWNIKVAVIVPSMLFGIVHVLGQDFSIGSCLLVIIAGTMVGVMFSMIAIESGSVWNSGIVHAIWNVVIIGGGLAIGEKMDKYSIMTYVLNSKDFAITGGEFGIESSVISLFGYIIVTLQIIFIHVLIRFYAVLEECMPVEGNLRKILMMLEELAQQSLQVKLLIYFI